MEVEAQSPEDIRQDQELTSSGVLSLPIDDIDLLAVINQKIKESDAHYRNTLKLFDRRKENESFWVGNHFDEKQLDTTWQVPYKDNIVWQDTETRISIASGRMPDIIVTPADETPEAEEEAKRVERAVKFKVDTDVMKRMVKDGLRHNHLSFMGAIKVRWDRNLANGKGDFTFELIQPDKVGMDHTATIPHDGFTADNMEIIYEWIEEPIGLILAKFPKKRDELMKYFGSSGNTSRLMVSKVRYREVHFTWYDREGKVYEGVCWIYRDLVLDKTRCPYFDWEGYDVPEQDELGVTTSIGKKYRNHFERPRKPYIFFSYQNLGKGPMDDTTAVEQALPIQKTVNKRGRQITEISDRAVPKIATSGQYITKEQARRISNDPAEILWLESGEDMSKAVTYIPGSPPNLVLFQDQVANRAQIDAKFSTSATTRGQTTTQESGISKQITREGDLTTADDIVDMVVERVIGECANWAVQMMRVMYDQPHQIKDTDQDGETKHDEMQRDMIPEGISVRVKANTVDKATRKAQAQDLASVKAIDPYSLFEDMEMPNPKQRAKRLLLFQLGAQDAYAKYMEEIGIDVGPTAEQPEGVDATEPVPAQEQQRAIQDIAQLQSGIDVEPQAPPSVPYLTTFQQFVQSDDFLALPPETQMLVKNYLQKLRALAESASISSNEPTPGTPQEPAPQPQPQPAASALTGGL